jgi:hypothetical protein
MVEQRALPRNENTRLAVRHHGVTQLDERTERNQREHEAERDD